MAKIIDAIGLFCVVLLLMKVEGKGTVFTVSWRVPSDAQSFNQWAQANRFQIGDSLVFNYPADQDSVLQVSQNDYTNCTTQSPINTYSDSHAVFLFNKSGPYYFISGNQYSCLKNEKLVVVVLADRSNSTANQTPPLPLPPSAAPDISPAPAPSTPPSPAPQNSPTPITSPSRPPQSTEIIPSPAPAGEASPAPLPPTVNPSPAPGSGLPSPSDASSIIPSCVGSIGALAAALIVAF